MNNRQETDRSDKNAQHRRLTIWKLVSPIIILVGIAWVVILLSHDLDSLRANFRIESISWLVFTIVAGVLALLFTVPVFQTLLSTHSNISVSYAYAARMLFVAQLLRHLPGRVWGILYLVADTRSNIPSAAMVRANIDSMVYAVYFNFLVASFLLLANLTEPKYAIIFAILAIFGLALAIRKDWLGRFAGLIAKLAPRQAMKYTEALSLRQFVPWSAVMTIVASYIVSWICYLAIWRSFSSIFPVLAEVNIWLLCASYSIAWVIGYMSMITPAGLGVREASFFTLAGSFMSLPDLAFLAVFVRLWQFVTEILVFLLFFFVKPAVEINDTAVTTNSS